MIKMLAYTERAGTCCHWSLTAKAGRHGANQEL